MKELLARADHHEREAARAFMRAADRTAEGIDAERLGLDDPFREIESVLTRNLAMDLAAALLDARTAGRISFGRGE